MSLRKQFEQVQKLIVKLSNRDFDQLSERGEDAEMVSAYIENLVMLGEELNETTVSRGYFQDIFNSVSDIILILDTKGKIITANIAMDKLTASLPENLSLNLFDDVFCLPQKKNAFAFLKKDTKEDLVKLNVRLVLNQNVDTVFHCNFGRLKSEERHVRYLALIKDITELDQYQQQVKLAAEKFKQIFDKSSDSILIVDTKGGIIETNLAARQFFGSIVNEKNTTNISDLIKTDSGKFSIFFAQACSGEKIENIELSMFSYNQTVIDCLLSSTPIFEHNMVTGHQVVIKNISSYKDYNIQLLNSIVDSQERERKRIATDLHDSIGQQLSGIKFMVNTLIGLSDDNVRIKEILQQVNGDIYKLLDELRQICFDLMPISLEKFGLIKTLEDHLQKINKASRHVVIKFQYPDKVPAISGKLEVSVYRIVQEFVNNSLKYSGCTVIEIIFDFESERFFNIILKDNGKGFNPALEKFQKGMGLSNVKSRVNAFKGSLEITSNKRTGTIFKIEIPQINHDIYNRN